MKKGLLALVVLGAIAGTVAYKLKKNQQEKELLDEELEILSGVETEEKTEETEESNEEESDDPDEIETEEEYYEESIETAVEEITEYDFSDKLEEVDNYSTEETVEDYEEVTEYDYSNKLEENRVEEIISEEIIEKSYIEEITDDCEIETESNIEELDVSNDIFEEERPIQHTIDFKSMEDMEAYKTVVIEKGYVVTLGENPYQLNVLHIGPKNKSELLVNVYYLANQAIKHHASYQGWQYRKVL